MFDKVLRNQGKLRMALTRHIPIKYKFLLILLFIMLLAFGIFFNFTFRMFSEDKTVFIMDLNLNVMTAVTHELKQEIGTRLEYIQSLAPRIYSLPKEKGKSFKGYGTSLPDEVLSFGFFHKSKKGNFERFRTFENIPLLKKHKISRRLLAVMNNRHPLPLKDFFKNKKLMLLNRSVQNKQNNTPVPILTVLIAATSFNDNQNIVIVVDFLQDFLINKLKASDLADILLISRKGKLLSHADPNLVVQYASKVYSHPVIERIQDRHPPKESLELTIKGQEYLCNVGEMGISDLYVISQIRKEEAFLALKILLTKSLILAIVILFASIAGSITFTSRVTAKIEKLELAAAQIGAGDLNTKIDIKSNDEIGKVSETFQWMVGRIKQLLLDTEHKVRMEEELKTAQLMQSTILSPPKVVSDHVEIAYYYCPATECGGDVWDVKVHNNRATLFLGDATGHGASAALVTSLVKSCFSTLHTAYVDRYLSPVDILDALNTIIFDSCRGKLLMTIIIVQLDMRTGELSVANAGHESPFCLRSSLPSTPSPQQEKQVDILLARGERLGFDENYKYKAEPYSMTVGDTVILYSDGLTEAANQDGKLFGERKLRKLLAQLNNKSLDSIKQRLITALNEHRGKTALEDDISFVLLRWKKPVFTTDTSSIQAA